MILSISLLVNTAKVLLTLHSVQQSCSLLSYLLLLLCSKLAFLLLRVLLVFPHSIASAFSVLVQVVDVDVDGSSAIWGVVVIEWLDEGIFSLGLLVLGREVRPFCRTFLGKYFGS